LFITVPQGEFLQRPSVRVQLDHSGGSHGRGQWRASSVDEHALWKQRQVANGRSDLAAALLDDDGGGLADREKNDDKAESLSRAPLPPGELPGAEWALDDEPEAPVAVSVGLALRDWRRRRARRHWWLTGRPAEEPGWFTDGCEGAAVWLLGACAPPPDPLRWRRAAAVAQPVAGPALLLALARAKWPCSSVASPLAASGAAAVAAACFAAAAVVWGRTRDARPLQPPTRVAVAAWSLAVAAALGAACAAEASAALATAAALAHVPPLGVSLVAAAVSTAALPTVDDLAAVAAAAAARVRCVGSDAQPTVDLQSPALAAVCALGAAVPVALAAILRLCSGGGALAAGSTSTSTWALVFAAVTFSVGAAASGAAGAFRAAAG
jgi:hypothetical protein